MRKFTTYVENWCLDNCITEKKLLTNAGLELSWLSQIKRGTNKNPGCMKVYKLSMAMKVPMQNLVRLMLEE